jgi:hypothetical protein
MVAQRRTSGLEELKQEGWLCPALLRYFAEGAICPGEAAEERSVSGTTPAA